MKHIRLGLPSPALIVACMALFAAVGGTTYAASANSAASHITWTNAQLQHPWTWNSSSGEARPGYAKDSLGVVHLRGGLKVSAGCSGAVAFVLPTALRPSHTMGLGGVRILSNGDVKGECASTLDGVSFVAGE